MYINELENFLIESLGNKLTQNQLIEAVKNQIWLQTMKKVDVSKNRIIQKFAQIKDEENVLKLDSDLSDFALDYISECSNKTDLIELMQEYGIGCFEFKAIERHSKFF